MIVSKTPYRISFCGGGTDYLSWFTQPKFRGFVVGSAINQFCYLLAKYNQIQYDYKTRIVYRNVEEVEDNNKIKHAAFREAIKYMGMQNENLDISHISDLPSFTGLGTSSAFMAGLLKVLYGMKGIDVHPSELLRSSFHVEHNIMCDNVGVQDAAWAVWGGLGVISFDKQDISYFKLNINEVFYRELERHCLLLFTNIKRRSTEIVGSYINKLSNKNNHNQRLLRITETAINSIIQGKINKLGECLNQNWNIKKMLSDKVTCDTINKYYEIGMSEGAFGGKLLGGGGGGTFLFLADPSIHKNIIQKTGLQSIPIRFHEEGSKIC